MSDATPARGPRTTRARLVALARPAFLVLAVVLLLLALRDQGPAVRDGVARTGWAATLGAFGLVLVGLAASAQVWRSLLADLGSPLPQRAALNVFFVGQLGKYLPGSVFAVAAQMELAKKHGAPRTRVATASLLFMGVLTATGLLVAAALLPFTSPAVLHRYAWALLAVPLLLAGLAPPVLNPVLGRALRLVRRPPLEHPLSWRGVGAATGWALAMWAAYGAHVLVLLVPQRTAPGHSLLPLSAGGYAFAWTVGFLFVIAPAGGLVREAALVLALAPVLASGPATAVAVVSRGLMTLGDLLWGAVGALLRRGAGHTTLDPGGTGVATVTTETGVKPRSAAADT